MNYSLTNVIGWWKKTLTDIDSILTGIYYYWFLVDNKTNKIVAYVPMFYHGNAMFNYAGRDDLMSREALTVYAKTLMPCAYYNFIGTAKKVLTQELRESLCHLLDFKFKKHPRYNLPDKRLKLLVQFVQKYGRLLLKK